MQTSTSSSPSFPEAVEKALDRAVRRLPGFWTWDYLEGNARPIAAISPPWDASHVAFVVFWHEGQPYEVEDCLEGRITGSYPDLDQMLRGIRAVVMGDPFPAEASSNEPQAKPQRKTAKGRPIIERPGELNLAEQDQIEAAIEAWHEAGQTAFEVRLSTIWAQWETRYPVFEISKEDGRYRLTDNLSAGTAINLSGVFPSLEIALEAARCVIRGDRHSNIPALQAAFQWKSKVQNVADLAGMGPSLPVRDYEVVRDVLALNAGADA